MGLPKAALPLLQLLLHGPGYPLLLLFYPAFFIPLNKLLMPRGFAASPTSRGGEPSLWHGFPTPCPGRDEAQKIERLRARVSLLCFRVRVGS